MPPLSSEQVLVLLDICLDAIDRCEERAKADDARGDAQGAEAHRQLRDKYEIIKWQLLDELGGGAPSAPVPAARPGDKAEPGSSR